MASNRSANSASASRGRGIASLLPYRQRHWVDSAIIPDGLCLCHRTVGLSNATRITKARKKETTKGGTGRQRAERTSRPTMLRALFRVFIHSCFRDSLGFMSPARSLTSVAVRRLNSAHEPTAVRTLWNPVHDDLQEERNRARENLARGNPGRHASVL